MSSGSLGAVVHGNRVSNPSLPDSGSSYGMYVNGASSAPSHYVALSHNSVAQMSEQRPGRIVTIGTPHQGSHVADRLARHAVGRWILGKSVLELAAGIPQRWRLPARDIGVITGNFPYGLGRFFPGMTRPNDGLLNANETELPGAADRLCIRVNHTALQFSRDAAEQTASFIRTGRFERT